MNGLRIIGTGMLWGGLLAVGGCLRTHSEVVISQPKPLEVNVNLNGKLTLVIQRQAQNDMDFIAGAAKAQATAATHPASAPHPSPGSAPGAGSLRLAPRGRLNSLGPVIFADAAPSRLRVILEHLRADFHRCHQLLAAHLTGEAHTGYMVARKKLFPSDARFVRSDNRWRKRLYELRARQQDTTVAQIGAIYFQFRVKFAPVGAWIQQFDPTARRWIWVHKG